MKAQAHESDCGYTVTGRACNCSCEAGAQEDLLTRNMEFAGVIRALRANAREDAKRIEVLERERDELRVYLDAAHYATCNAELRQQRDEAMADRDIARLKALESDRAHDRMVGELEGVYKERDEARDVVTILCDGEPKRNFAQECKRLECERNEAREKLKRITSAAQAVVDRWEQPSWKDAEPTAAVIYRLRDAIGEAAK